VAEAGAGEGLLHRPGDPAFIPQEDADEQPGLRVRQQPPQAVPEEAPGGVEPAEQRTALAGPHPGPRSGLQLPEHSLTGQDLAHVHLRPDLGGTDAAGQAEAIPVARTAFLQIHLQQGCAPFRPEAKAGSGPASGRVVHHDPFHGDLGALRHRRGEGGAAGPGWAAGFPGPRRGGRSGRGGGGAGFRRGERQAPMPRWPEGSRSGKTTSIAGRDPRRMGARGRGGVHEPGQGGQEQGRPPQIRHPGGPPFRSVHGPPPAQVGRRPGSFRWERLSWALRSGRRKPSGWTQTDRRAHAGPGSPDSIGGASGSP
jgi:hypothetical protein